MGLLNTGLWDDFLPGDTDTNSDVNAGGIDSAQVIDEALWSLHAATRADLVFWTEAQLLQWLDEAVKRLASIAGVFIGRNVGLTGIGTATAALPIQHIATLHVSVDGVAIRPANTMELEARDEAYQTTQGTPDSWYEDLLGHGVLGLAPVPDAELPLAEIYEGWPTALDIGQTIVAGPAPLKGYLGMCLLAAAYGTEGELEMPDVAAHCRGRVEMYHQMMRSYYGAGF
jgi:hypothetical protein